LFCVVGGTTGGVGDAVVGLFVCDDGANVVVGEKEGLAVGANDGLFVISVGAKEGLFVIVVGAGVVKLPVSHLPLNGLHWKDAFKHGLPQDAFLQSVAEQRPFWHSVVGINCWQLLSLKQAVEIHVPHRQ
jgi:hypothetical protein